MEPSSHTTTIGMELLSPKFVVVPKALAEIYTVMMEFLPPADQKKAQPDTQKPENGKKTNGDISESKAESKAVLNLNDDKNKASSSQRAIPIQSNGDQKLNQDVNQDQEENIMKVIITIRDNFEIHFLKLFAKVSLISNLTLTTSSHHINLICILSSL